MEIANFKINGINPGCHGIPERCLTIGRKRMKICARCFGSTIGNAFAFILMCFNRLPHWHVSVALIALLIIDWSLQEFAGIQSNNPRRLVTGLLGGFGIGAIILSLIVSIVKA
jgi:uncharacterized membrane protein